MLNLPQWNKTHTLFDETDPDKPTLNYLRLLRHYADVISATDPTCGLQYYYTVHEEDERYVGSFFFLLFIKCGITIDLLYNTLTTLP